MKNELSLVRISRALMNFCSGILRLRYTMVKKKSKRKRKRRVKEPLTDELLVKLSGYYGVSIDYILMQTNHPARYP